MACKLVNPGGGSVAPGFEVMYAGKDVGDYSRGSEP